MTQRRHPAEHPSEHHADRTRPTAPVGLYDPAFEHDACGVAFVARLNGDPEPRDGRARDHGAREPRAPRRGRRRPADRRRRRDPAPAARRVLPRGRRRRAAARRRSTASRVCFLPRDDAARRAELEQLARAHGRGRGPARRLLARRADRPRRTSATPRARSRRSSGSSSSPPRAELAGDQDAFERKLYVIRRVAELAAGPDLDLPELLVADDRLQGDADGAAARRASTPTCATRGLKSALALVHSRFSTNTFPSWELAHPYRMIAHNGEINTLRGNVNWMRARESQLASELFGDDLQKVLPVVRPGGSDSANFDNVLELLVLAGRSLPHAMMMMIPEAYDGRDDVPDDAARLLRLPRLPDGAVGRPGGDRVHRRHRDRRDARPQRPAARPLAARRRTAGSSSRPRPACSTSRPRTSLRKGRLQPGKIFLVDLDAAAASSRTRRSSARSRRGSRTASGSSRACVHLDDLPERPPRVPRVEPLRSRQLAFGYTQEDLRVILAPLARNAEEPIGSMGNDLALAVLSDQRPLLYSYFKQLFAQVTNPPIDSMRETVVMSVAHERRLRAQPARRDARARPPARDRPADPAQRRARERCARSSPTVFKAHTIDITWPVAEGAAGLERRSSAICARGRRGARRRRQHPDPLRPQPRRRPRRRSRRCSPSSAVHHHLVREGTRLAGRPRGRVGRAARGAPLRDADRLRRRRGQPVRDARDARRARRRGLAAGRDDRRGGRRSARSRGSRRGC